MAESEEELKSLSMKVKVESEKVESSIFLVALGLRCCAWAFSGCRGQDHSLVATCGLLTVVAFLVSEHRFQGA